MKQLLLTLCLVLSTQCFMGKPRLEEVSDMFGRTVQVSKSFWSQRGTQTILDTKNTGYGDKPEQTVEMLKSIVDNKEELYSVAETSIIQCQPGHPDFFKFVAHTAAVLSNENPTQNSPSFCFSSIEMSLKKTTSSLSVTITSSGKTGDCTDSYIIVAGNHSHFGYISKESTKTYTFKNLDVDDWTFINSKIGGVQIYRFCESIAHFIPSLWMTVRMFVGGLGSNPYIPFFGSHVPRYMQKLNVEFVKKATGFQWRDREPVVIDYKAENIRSGDFFAITRFDGLDNIIHWGAGSHSGHSVMALWDRTGEEPELYIVESQDAWYWPTHGLQRTKWETWKKHAKAATFNVAHLPLRDEYHSKFNEKKAWDWFKETEGLPYGYRNFIFSWIDTKDNNIPLLTDFDFLFLLFRLMESIPGKPADRIIKEALNWRLGTEGLNLYQIQEMAAKKNMTIGDLAAIVEKDKVKYSDGYSYVCSAYVASFYLQSGMLGDIVINPPEFTPRDIYTLNVFESNPKRIDECVKADPDLPYCQIMGFYKMDLPGYNSIVPYNNMAERCPSRPPLYLRPAGC